MSNKPVLTIALAFLAGICLAPDVLNADFYDNFDDGSYTGDPNGWDIDNPPWTIYEPLGGPNAAGVVDGTLQLWTAPTFFPSAALLAYPDDGDTDPNTSETFWGHTLDHYVVAWTKNMRPQADPNDEGGESILMLHADINTWMAFGLEYPYRKYSNDRVLPRISAVDGLEWRILKRGEYEPGDPCHPDEAGGFWMLFMYDSDGNTDPEDPNGKFLRGAFWNGDKYDWDGTWFLEVDLGDPNTWRGDPNAILATDWWRPMGRTTAGTGEYIGTECYVAFDHVEARTGTFDPNAKHLDLEIKNSKYGQVQIDPDLPDPNDTYDPNTVDPNDGLTFPQERLLRYTTGTEVVLVAQPMVDRSFKNWTVYDPNYPGDGNYATLDSNAVLYLTMHADYQVEALFNCGSGLPPFVVMTLLALGLGVVIRRMA